MEQLNHKKPKTIAEIQDLWYREDEAEVYHHYSNTRYKTLNLHSFFQQGHYIGTAMIPDYELEFRGVATIVPKKGAEVPVLMWEIDQQDELNLNSYEGFPRLYRKEIF